MSLPSRELFRSILNNDFLIKRRSPVSDGMGGIASYTEVTLYTVRGRMRPSVPDEIRTADRMETNFSHVLYVEANVSVNKNTDYIVLSGRPEHYRIVDVREPSFAQFHYQIHLQEEIGGD